MNKPTTISYALVATLALAGGCKRAESSANPTATATATPPAVQPAMPSAAAAPAAAPAAPAVDPRWPRWIPAIPGVRLRPTSPDFIEGGAERNVLELLIDSRRACEQGGYTLSPTSIARTAWDQKFVFTCTRAEEFIRVELTGQPARPNYTSFNASNGEFARTMMRQRRR